MLAASSMGLLDVSAAAARALARALARFYYPQIAIDGAGHLPRRGPVLLVANHPNSLLDPLLLGIVAERPVRLLAKAPLFTIPVFGPALRALGMIPAYRGQDNRQDVRKNVESLERAAQALVAGGVVGLFPEGKSHDELQVAMVRSGAARLALQALKAGARDLRIVPVGINYESKERFRSAVWLNVGEPIDLAAWRAGQGGEEDQPAMRALTAEIDARLKRVVIHLSKAEWAPLLDEVTGLLPPPRRRDAPAYLRLRKTVAEAVNRGHEQEAEAATALVARVEAFSTKRDAVGLPPGARFFRDALWRRGLRLVVDALALAGATAIGAVGLLHHLVPYALTRLVVGRLETGGRMTLALYRLLVGLPLYAAWYALVGWYLLQAFQPWVAVGWSCLMPWAGLLALEAGRRWRTLAPAWWAECRLLLRRAEAGQLRQEFRELQAALLAFASKVSGPRPPVEAPRVVRPPVWLQASLAAAAAVVVLGAAGWLLRDRPLELWRTDAPALQAVPAAQLTAQLAADERALAAVIAGLSELEARSAVFSEQLQVGERSFYRPDDEDEIRRMLMTFLSYRAALLRLVWHYQRFHQIEAEMPRLRALLLHYTAAAVAYDYSARFVLTFEDAPNAQRKLNEPEPRWDLQPGTYDRLRANLGSLTHRRWLERSWQNYHETLPAWVAQGLGPGQQPPYAGFHAAIATAGARTARLNERLLRYKVATAVADVQGTAGGGFYRAGAAISTLVGDARLRAPRNGRPLITAEALQRLRPLLRPGDILIERRNWYLSNAFLPGYWPHAALYVGTRAELAELGLDQDPRVAGKLALFDRGDDLGHPFAIIEAVSEGVVFTSVEHSIGEADAVAVLRPKLPPEVVREGIARAFSHVGKPYDFDFDFFSSDKLVCTEVVYRSLGDALELPLVEILGRRTLPALEIVRHWTTPAGNGRLEFVALLDGDERSGQCHWADERTLADSVQRPALTWLQ